MIKDTFILEAVMISTINKGKISESKPIGAFPGRLADTQFL